MAKALVTAKNKGTLDHNGMSVMSESVQCDMLTFFKNASKGVEQSLKEDIQGHQHMFNMTSHLY